jgi:hypothetical protein
MVLEVRFMAAAKEEGVSAGPSGSASEAERATDPDSALEVLTRFLGDFERPLRLANEIMDRSASFLFPLGLSSWHDDRMGLAVEETDEVEEEAGEAEATGCWSSCHAKTRKSLYDSTNFSRGDEARISGDVGQSVKRTEVVADTWCMVGIYSCTIAGRGIVMWSAVVG